jgi:two-component system, LytTR family, sensor kinase
MLLKRAVKEQRYHHMYDAIQGQEACPKGFPILHSRWGRWVMFILGWTILSLLFVPETYLFFLYRGDAIPWTRTIALTLANAGIAFLFIPAIVWLTRRFPLEQRVWRRSVLVHIPACLVFSLSHSWLYAALCYASPALFHMLFIRFHPNLLTYWAIVGFTQALDYFRRYTDREKQLAQAELHLLRSQLHPHFLFNTLHTIAAMMHEDVAGADRMIHRLSDLLRLTLESIGEHEVPLTQELEFLKTYVEIERIRFQERLTLVVDVCPEALDAMVPSMLLQPLVENSIRHGFVARASAGTIKIEAHRQGDRLVLKVLDDGPGFPTQTLTDFSDGLGLPNTQRRLEQLYRGAYRFELQNSLTLGASLSIEVPFHVRSMGSAQVAGPRFHEDSADSNPDRGRRALGTATNRVPAQG